MRTGTFVALAAILWISPIGAHGAGAPGSGRQRDGGRQRPPQATATFACDRNNLTVYTGVVTSYRRRVGETSLRIRTDADTTERVSLKHPGTDDPSAHFHMNGEPFTPADWTRIEARKGVLRDATRASAWVCSDGQVLVDWGVRREG